MPFFGSLGILIARGLIVAAVVVYLFSEISTLVGNGLPGFFDGSVRFNNPFEIAIGSAGVIYVVDNGNNCIRKITSTGVVTTLAGSTSGYLDGTGTNARFLGPSGVAVDSAENVYVSDAGNHRIRKITPAGVVTTLAGSGTGQFADGMGTAASFFGPQGVAVDSAGNVYVSDSINYRIRKISPLGAVSTLAGSGTNAVTDGTGTNASFSANYGISIDSTGTLYVVGSGNRVRKISPLGAVSTLAGNGTAGAINGTGTNASFANPLGVAVDSAGNVYVSDASNHRIRSITPGGVVSTFVGSTQGFANGTGTNANFNEPYGLAVDSVGNVYVGDLLNHRIRKITATGIVTTLAGSGVAGFTDSVNIFLYNPHGVGVDSVGNVYVADSYNNRIRKITPSGVVTTLAGSTFGSADGVGTNATFNDPRAVAVDSAGNVYVADQGRNNIRKITPAGVVSTFAGNTQGFLDGDGTNARFWSPQGIALDSVGNVYVADYFNHRIRKITPGGIVSTLTGSGSDGSADGTGTSATHSGPIGIAVDSAGFVYVAEQGSHRIRKITPGGIVSTFAGSRAGSVDDMGTNARFNTPSGLALDSEGNVYVADLSNHLIRKITPLGLVSTVAGQLTPGSTDGTGTNARFTQPNGVAVDSVGNVYVADKNNDRIRKITPSGVVTTLAGSTFGYSDGGWFTNPIGVATDWDGTIYVADTNNHRIRKITSTGIVSTLAGNGAANFADGTGTNAYFNTPLGVAVNSVRMVYVADSINRRIRAITTTGYAFTFAGSTSAGFADGTGVSATFNTPVGITVDPLDIVYVSDIGNHNIRRITSAGAVTSLAGSRTATFADGVGTNASFNTPSGIVADIYGNVYVADTNNHRIRRITSDGTVTTLAGSTPGYVDGTGTNAQFNFPYHLSIDSLGILYVADQTNHRIRKIQPSTGVVTTLAGDGMAGFTFSRFNTPQGITVDRFRQAYVGDNANHSIRKIANVYTLPENNGATNTIAGDGTAQFLAGNGIGARFNLPRGVGVDSIGNVYVGDLLNHRIRKITPAGVVSVFAGSGTPSFLDGTGTNARFSSPWGVAADSEGNVYVGDLNTNRIRKISPLGVVSTLAGSGTATFANGTGAGASFNGPQQVAVDREGNVYVADGNNRRIRKITPSGVVSTLAGSGTATVTNGVGTSASFSSPQGVAVDSEGVVYVADYGGHRIRRISNVGVVTTLAGSTQGSANGIGTSATFNFPRGITVDSVGNVYVADESNHRIRKITPAGVVTTLAGTTQGFQDGIGTNARFNFPVGMSVDSVGNVYVGDRTNNRIRKIGTAVAQLPLNRGVVTTFAGSTQGFANGTGTSALFFNPSRVAVDSTGNVYVGEFNNNRIRRITPSGVVSTFAGSATAGSTNATGTNATFNGPSGVAVDSGGFVYVADVNNNRIRKITPLGVVSTLAGSGTAGFFDASGLSAQFNSPVAVAVDSVGNVFVADSTNNRIRRITPGGVVSTLAGSGISQFGDGTGAGASFNRPSGVAVDSAGNVYVADAFNHRIRRITPGGVVTTIAGSGTGTFADGTGASASFWFPIGIAVDSEGVVYVADEANQRIRKITPLGVVSTLAGSGSIGTINATGTEASFRNPSGVAVDSGGILYIADNTNHRIRKIQ